MLKQYGPVVGLLLAFIFWQSRWINKLLDRHEKAYSGEIERMHQQMNKLLEFVLGKQPSSQTMPPIKDVINDAERQARSLPGSDKKPGEEEKK